MRVSRRRPWLAILAAAAPLGCRPATSQETAPAVAVASARAEIRRDAATPGGELTPEQRRGKRIYLEGRGDSESPISALIGSSRDAVPASLVSCGNCHGRDGHGRPEGGIEPTDVTWSALGRPAAAFGKRSRPAYTAALVGRAITMGLDPAGVRLGLGMPRYRLSHEDLADLVAYLEVLGTELDPGISATTITLGTLLPSERAASGLRQAIARTLQAYADDLNRRGGIYNRRVVLQFEDLDPSPGEAGGDVSVLLKRGKIFALLAPYIAGREEAVARAVREEGTPLIGPFAAASTPGGAADGPIFHIHPGIEELARALAILALERGTPRAPAILVGNDPGLVRAADAVAGEWVKAGCTEPERITIPAVARGGSDLASLVNHLAERRTDVLAYLGPDGLITPLLAAADRASCRPSVYLPGALAGGDILELPPSFDGRVFLSLPYLPEDVTRSGQDEYARLESQHGLSRDHRAAQLAVLAAAKVLEEGLRRCGRDVSRARLVEELERLEEFSTGYSRPLTFGPNRRIGSSGAYVLAADLAAHRLRPIGWTDLGGRR